MGIRNRQNIRLQRANRKNEAVGIPASLLNFNTNNEHHLELVKKLESGQLSYRLISDFDPVELGYTDNLQIYPTLQRWGANLLSKKGNSHAFDPLVPNQVWVSIETPGGKYEMNISWTDFFFNEDTQRLTRAVKLSMTEKKGKYVGMLVVYENGDIALGNSAENKTEAMNILRRYVSAVLLSAKQC